MTLLFVDGFDHYDTANIGKKWTGGAGGSIISNGGRRGGGCYYVTNGGINRSLGYNAAKIIVGMAAKINPGGAAGRTILSLNDSGTPNFGLSVSAGNNIVVGKPDYYNQLGVSAKALTVGAYAYIEIMVVLHTSAGSFELRVNGETWLSATNIRTNYTANNYANSLFVGANGTFSEAYIDDLYVCDGLGTKNNTFLGDSRVDTLYPVSDGGTLQFTPSTGTSHYACVDETVPSTTDYVESSTVGNIDLYKFSTLPVLASSSISGVQVTPLLNKDDAGARSASITCSSGASSADSTSLAITTTPLYYPVVFENDPATSATWANDTAVNNAYFGPKVAA